MKKLEATMQAVTVCMFVVLMDLYCLGKRGIKRELSPCTSSRGIDMKFMQFLSRIN